MPGPEAVIRKRVLEILRTSGDAMAVDNECCMPGTPDVNYLMARDAAPPFEGWIELKQIAVWPRYDHEVVKVPKFTQKQRVWLKRRWEAGGLGHLLLRIGRVRYEWFLFDAIEAQRVGVSMTKHEMQVTARREHTSGPLGSYWLVNCLRAARRP